MPGAENDGLPFFFLFLHTAHKHGGTTRTLTNTHKAGADGALFSTRCAALSRRTGDEARNSQNRQREKKNGGVFRKEARNLDRDNQRYSEGWPGWSSTR